MYSGQNNSSGKFSKRRRDNDKRGNVKRSTLKSRRSRQGEKQKDKNGGGDSRMRGYNLRGGSTDIQSESSRHCYTFGSNDSTERRDGTCGKRGQNNCPSYNISTRMRSRNVRHKYIRAERLRLTNKNAPVGRNSKIAEHRHPRRNDDKEK